MKIDLRKRLAVVTGVGHSEDIGTAICRQLANQGAAIFFTYWQAEKK